MNLKYAFWLQNWGGVTHLCCVELNSQSTLWKDSVPAFRVSFVFAFVDFGVHYLKHCSSNKLEQHMMHHIRVRLPAAANAVWWSDCVAWYLLSWIHWLSSPSVENLRNLPAHLMSYCESTLRGNQRFLSPNAHTVQSVNIVCVWKHRFDLYWWETIKRRKHSSSSTMEVSMRTFFFNLSEINNSLFIFITKENIDALCGWHTAAPKWIWPHYSIYSSFL